MAKRKAISKKMRFEVFKRDAFKCQYCGATAPDVVLHVDHMKPVAKGGTNSITNLITSCINCNSGKSDKELTDDTVVSKKRKQLEELQERKEQLELMMEWEQELLVLDEEKINSLADYWNTLTKEYSLNERGKETLRKLVAKFPYDEILKAIKIASQQYFKLDNSGEKYTQESIEYGWKKIPGIVKINLSGGYDEDYAKMHYIKGILRNRHYYVDEREALDLMKRAKELNASMESIQKLAKTCDCWDDWREELERYIEERETRLINE